MLHNRDNELKLWTQNRVIEMTRFTNIQAWRYVQSSNVIADIRTRPGLKLEDADCDSTWTNGFQGLKRLKKRPNPKNTQDRT